MKGLITFDASLISIDCELKSLLLACSDSSSPNNSAILDPLLGVREGCSACAFSEDAHDDSALRSRSFKRLFMSTPVEVSMQTGFTQMSVLFRRLTMVTLSIPTLYPKSFYHVRDLCSVFV